MDSDRLSKLPVDSNGQPLLAMVRITANREKVIPKDYERLIPSEEITISSLLNTPLPTILSSVNLLRPAKSCVVCEPPSWTEDQLKTVRIPSKEWLMVLDAAIVDGWPKGARSVEHPSDTKIRFPLWVGTFWTAISEVIQQRNEWRRAQEWVLTLTQGRETHEVQAIFNKIPRKMYIWILPVEADRTVTKISFFAQLLSDGFLAERHIDAFVAYLNIQVRRRTPKAPGILVADLPLSVILSNYFDATADKIRGCKPLLQYTAVFKSAAYRRLLFPAHVGGAQDGHWVVFSVDFAKSEYSFGNSLKNVSYKKDITKICRGLDRWMTTNFHRSFKNLGQILPIGTQQDGISCGICVLSALEHALLDVPLFTHDRRNLLRIRYFMDIAELLLDHRLAPRYHKTVNDLVKFHPIRKSWDLDEAALQEEGGDGEEGAITDVEDVEAKDVEEEDIEDGDGEELEVEDIDEVDDISTWSSVAPSSLAFGVLTDDGSLPPSSDASTEFVDTIDSDSGEVQGQQTLKRKASDELGVGTGSRWKVARREEAGALSDSGSGVETDDDTKQSRSAIASRRLRESVKSGDFVVDERKRTRFEEKCVEMDCGAKFRYGDVGWQVLHSKCSKWHKVSEPYNTTRFKSHVRTCTAKGKERNASITSFFKLKDPNDINTEAKPKIIVPGRKQIFVGGSTSTSTLIKPPPRCDNQLVSQTKPCFGISDIQDPRVPAYISRTVVEGAGSISLKKATQKLYGDMEYSALTDNQKATVAVTQSHLRSWSINRELRVVFSTRCMKFVERDRQPPKTICDNCEKVARSDAFKRALRVKPPPLEAMKFIPLKYRNALADLGTKFAHIQGLSELLREDPQTSIWVRFVRGVMKGEYNDKLVFLAMIQATVVAHDRESRGVGLQNMQYQPIYEEFTQMVALTSPRAYRLFAPHIQLPTLRHHRMLRSQLPPFPRFICDDCFLLAQGYMASVNYSGPIALACDDSKLHPSLQVVWDNSLNSNILIGTTLNEPVLVANPEELQKLLVELGDKLATKLRLWCMQVPLIGIPSMIVAAEAIPNDLTTEVLYEKSREVIDGLKRHGVNVISYACDGTQVERSVQDLLVARATGHISHTIPDPEDGHRYEIRIPMYRLSPVVMIQDSKHAAKTLRNNLFSGARALVLGNHVAMYSYVRDMAFSDLPGCPLYHRDVEKLDRQDDNAATRLFSAVALDFVTKQFPDRLGLVVYLFVMGEVVDAYQSRVISHLERIKMVLRCRYFLRLWKRFLNAAGYAESRHYISREADDILDTLIDGLIGLVYVYRDHLAGERYPLLLWLHSTEICEHVFAECRKLVKDFSHLNFLYMTSRLHVLIRAASLFSKGTDPKAQAMGYSHSHLDPEDARIESLATYPTDGEIALAVGEAWDEAVTLLGLLGIQADDIPTSPTNSATDTSSPAPNPDEPDSVEHPDEETEAGALQNLISVQQTPGWRAVDSETQDQMDTLTCAAIALEIEERRSLVELSEGSNIGEHEEFIRRDAATIQDARNTLKTPTRSKRMTEDNIGIVTASLLSRIVESDLSQLVAVRRAHQTKRAANSVKTRASPRDVTSDRPPEQTDRQRLCAQMAEVIRRAGSGLERDARWKSGTAPGTKSPAEVLTLTGNSANAEVAAKQRVNTARATRAEHFNGSGINLSRYLADGLVGDGRSSGNPPRLPLKAGDWAFVYWNEKIYTGRVLACYSKEAGAGSRHAWQASTSAITALSYLVVQAFEGTTAARNRFRSIHRSKASIRAETFLHIPSSKFLCRLQEEVKYVDAQTILVGDKDWTAFQKFCKCLQSLEEAIAKLNGATRGGKKM